VPAYPVAVEETDALPLLEYWRIILKRRWTIVSILLLVFVTGAIWTLKQPRVYRAKAVLQIDRENQNIVTFGDLVNLESDDLYLETAYKVLQSRTLARLVIDKLQLDKVPEFAGAPKTANSAGSAPALSSSPVRDEARLDPQYDRVVSSFLVRLTVNPIRRSRLVEVSFDSYDPGLAARVANTLASNYIDQNLEAKWQATQKASELISQQLVGLRAKLEKSEEELQRYAKENSILLIDEKQSMVAEKLKQIQEEYTKAEADRFQKESVYNLVRSGDLTAVPGMQESQAYQQLSVKLTDLKREYSDLSPTFTAEWPKVKKLKSQIDEYEQALERERVALARRVTNDYQAAVNRAKLLQEAVAAQTKEFNDIGEKSIQYNINKREVDTNRQLFEGLTQRLKEAGVSAGMQASNIRVVDQAEVPLNPYRPRILVNFAIALVVGLALGLGLAFFQEYLDDTLKTPEEVERYLHLPTLGIIPAIGSRGAGRLGYGYRYGYGYGYGYGHRSRKQLPETAASKQSEITAHSGLIGAKGTAPLAEAYRSLRTSILLSTAERPPRLLLVTSSQMGEGKTTTVVNLGITLAQLGSRTLVIDSDMRKPRLAQLLQMKKSGVGLSTYLAGHSSLDETVFSTEIPNLYAVPCGPIPPNPAELVSSDRMRQLLEEVRKTFDYVLLDSPPVMHVADARILGAQTEAVVLIVQGGATPRELVDRAKLQLLQVNANVIGVALNNVDFSSAGYDYYYRYYRSRRYSYGYGYGYGSYGSGSDEEAATGDASKASAPGDGSSGPVERPGAQA
jgi:capsular exopolysaccharide synthesis family protein